MGNDSVLLYGSMGLGKPEKPLNDKEKETAYLEFMARLTFEGTFTAET